MKRQLTSLGNGLIFGTTAKRRLASLGGLLIVAAVGGVAACQDDGPLETTSPIGDNEFGVNLEGLGVAFNSCVAANTTDYVAADKTLTLDLDNDTDAVISVVGGKLKVNGHLCRTAPVPAAPNATPPTLAVAAADLTSTNVNRLNITADNTNKVVIDLLPGVFGGIIGTNGGIVITGNAKLGIRGSATANFIKMGQEAAGLYYFELSGDAKPDLKLAGTPGTVTLALGDGNDTFTALGQVMDTTSLEGTADTVDVTLPVLVYGGTGNDILKGGLGNDTLDGGDGNDLFQMSTGSLDGADTYVGGSGTDTVDYSGRTDGVAVSVAPTYSNAWVEGVSLFNRTVTAALDVVVNNSVSTTFTFGAGATTPGTILTALNGGNLATIAQASINDRGELVLVKKGGLGPLTITSGTANLFTPGVTNNGGTQLLSDPDDGIGAEGDDVRADVENITGGSGNDTLTGGIGSDTINGGAGDDSIAGGPAGTSCTDDVDVLNGNDGDDVFVMGGFTNCGDAVDGGGGRDIADYQMRTAGVSFLADTVANDGQPGEADKVLATVEIILGGGANDTMTGGTGNDEFHGGPGADILSGGAGNDSIVGGPGADTLLGGAGEDYFNETDKIDQYADSDGTLHDAFLMAHFGSPVGPGQPDIINGGADFDSCDYGRASTTAMTVTLCRNDTNVTTGNACTTGSTDTVDLDDIVNCDDFVAGAGNDTITGSTGDDMISGGWGADSIVGGEGNDELNGNLTTGGTDTINGGLGQDICGTATTITGCEL